MKPILHPSLSFIPLSLACFKNEQRKVNTPILCFSSHFTFSLILKSKWFEKPNFCIYIAIFIDRYLRALKTRINTYNSTPNYKNISTLKLLLDIEAVNRFSIQQQQFQIQNKFLIKPTKLTDVEFLQETPVILNPTTMMSVQRIYGFMEF